MRRLRILLLLVPLLHGCATASDPWKGAKPGQKRVIASFPPLYSMTQAIAGDDAYVLTLLSEVGPHDAKDSPTDMLKLRRADLVVINGLGLDDRLMDLLMKGAMNRAPVVKAGDAVKMPASKPPDMATPCRASFLASSRRALASRLDSVPSGILSCRLTSLRARPSRSQSTTGTR